MAQETAGDKPASAAVLVIGDEILSGRTQDVNTRYIANYLAQIGVDLASHPLRIGHRGFHDLPGEFVRVQGSHVDAA